MIRRKVIAELMPRGRLRVHERLRPDVVRRGPPFDRVRRERERRPGEADQRNTSVELRAQQPDRLEHVRRVARAARRSCRRSDVCGRRGRGCDRRPFALDEIQIEPHRHEGQQQIGKQDRRIDLDEIDRLQRDRGRKLGLRQISRSE